MKKIIITIIMFFSLISLNYSTNIYLENNIDIELFDDYSKGFKDGYIAGYCYNEYGCITPIVPICPIRRINEQNTYKDGYNRGFSMGKHDKKNK